jgi:C-terminal peptidase prc
MSRLVCLALSAVIALGASRSAWAIDEKSPPAAIYAVVIGASEFKDKTLKARPNARIDAKALYDVLTDKAVGGLAADNVQLLLTGTDDKRKATEATKTNILAAFKKAVEKAGPDDRIFVVWFGSGASAGERTCFFAADSTFKDREKDAITAAELEADFKNVKAKEVVAFLDVDLKGFETPKDQTVLEPNIMDFVRVFLGVKEKDDAEPPAGRAVLLAGSGTNPVVVVDGNEGIFARAIVDGLKGGADKDGYEPDGIVTVDELNKYAENEVPNLARKHGKNEEAKQQLPIFIAKSSHYVLSRNPAVTAKVEERLKKLAELESQNKITKEMGEEGKRLLSRMPNLAALQQLRKNYQALTDGKLTDKEFVSGREKLLSGMKLDEDSAKLYAKRLVFALERYQKSYIKELDLGEMVGQAIRGLYVRADQKMPNEIEDRVKKAKGQSKNDLLDLLRDARIPLGKREDFDRDRDVEMSIQSGIFKLVDPYTDYTDKDKVDEREKDLQGFFTGIGVVIRRDLVKDALLVVSPIKGSPAYLAGLKAGDFIVKIRREVDSRGEKLNPPEETSTKGMKVQDAVKLILGTPGTKVKVYVERPGADGEKEYEITRGLVEVESVLGFKRKDDDSWDYFIDPDSKIAYIYLSQFSRNSLVEMDKAIKRIQKDGAKGLVLDLRFDPGGYLDIARDICDLFIEDGLIVTIKPRVGEEYAMIGKNESIHRQRGKPDYPFASHTNFPMVVLINGGSASASEILSACLQDHNRAFVMGERSFGKGSVQNVQELKDERQQIDLGEIKLTTATFWRPNGKNLNKSSTKGGDDEDWGVRPDKNGLIKLTPQETAQLADRLREWSNIPNRDAKPNPETEKNKDFKDRQLDGALEYLKNQIKIASNKTAKKDS